MNNVGKCFACFFWGGFVSFSEEDFFLFLRRIFSFSEEDFWGGFFLIQRRSSSFSEENCATAKRKSTLYCSLNGQRARTGPQFSSFQPFRLSEMFCAENLSRLWVAFESCQFLENNIMKGCRLTNAMETFKIQQNRSRNILNINKNIIAQSHWHNVFHFTTFTLNFL